MTHRFSSFERRSKRESGSFQTARREPSPSLKVVGNIFSDKARKIASSFFSALFAVSVALGISAIPSFIARAEELKPAEANSSTEVQANANESLKGEENQTGVNIDFGKGYEPETFFANHLSEKAFYYLLNKEFKIEGKKISAFVYLAEALFRRPENREEVGKKENEWIFKCFDEIAEKDLIKKKEHMDLLAMIFTKALAEKKDLAEMFESFSKFWEEKVEKEYWKKLRREARRYRIPKRAVENAKALYYTTFLYNYMIAGETPEEMMNAFVERYITEYLFNAAMEARKNFEYMKIPFVFPLFIEELRKVNEAKFREILLTGVMKRKSVAEVFDEISNEIFSQYNVTSEEEKELMTILQRRIESEEEYKIAKALREEFLQPGRRIYGKRVFESYDKVLNLNNAFVKLLLSRGYSGEIVRVTLFRSFPIMADLYARTHSFDWLAKIAEEVPDISKEEMRDLYNSLFPQVFPLRLLESVEGIEKGEKSK